MFLDQINFTEVRERIGLVIDKSSINYVISDDLISGLIVPAKIDWSNFLHKEFYLTIVHDNSRVRDSYGYDFIGVQIQDNGPCFLSWDNSLGFDKSGYLFFSPYGEGISDIDGFFSDMGANEHRLRDNSAAKKAAIDVYSKLIRFVTLVLNGKKFECAEDVKTKKIKTGKKKKGYYNSFTRVYLDKPSAKYSGVNINKIEWKQASHVRGHWRKIDSSAIGKDSLGNYSVVGKTWVLPHIKNKHLPLLPQARCVNYANRR